MFLGIYPIVSSFELHNFHLALLIIHFFVAILLFYFFKMIRKCLLKHFLIVVLKFMRENFNMDLFVLILFDYVFYSILDFPGSGYNERFPEYLSYCVNRL